MEIPEQLKNQINNLDYDFYMKKDIGNGIYLSEEEIGILTKYQIDYKNISSMKQLIFEIEDCIDELTDCDDLEWLSQTISEQDYYQNTNK